MSFFRPGHQAGRLLFLGQGLPVGPVNGVQVVAVQLDGVPAEGPCPRSISGTVPAEIRLAALAQAIHVDNGDQVMEFIIRGLVEGFPDRTFGHLAIAEQDPQAIGKFVQVLAVESHADADGQALAEGAGGHVDIGQHPGIGMALQRTTELAQAHQFLVGDRPGRLEQGVEQGTGMTLAEDEAVIVRMMRLGPVEAKVIRQKDRHEVRRGHAGRRMARPRCRGAPNTIDTELPCQFLQVLHHNPPWKDERGRRKKTGSSSSDLLHPSSPGATAVPIFFILHPSFFLPPMICWPKGRNRPAGLFTGKSMSRIEGSNEASTRKARRIDVAATAQKIIANMEKVIIGKRPQITLTLVAYLCEGHILLEDVPGVAKTMLARALARCIGYTFKRIQCTPDLLPTDVTGVSVFNQKSTEFEFRPGPIFAQTVLADEINRATPRTQSALLEAMAERRSDGRWPDLCPQAALPGHCHPESGRSRGDFPVAGGSARPLSHSAGPGLSQPGGRVEDAATAAARPSH